MALMQTDYLPVSLQFISEFNVQRRDITFTDRSWNNVLPCLNANLSAVEGTPRGSLCRNAPGRQRMGAAHGRLQ